VNTLILTATETYSGSTAILGGHWRWMECSPGMALCIDRDIVGHRYGERRSRHEYPSVLTSGEPHAAGRVLGGSSSTGTIASGTIITNASQTAAAIWS